MALILTGDDVEAALPMAECIASQERAFREHALGTARVPPRIVLGVPEHDGVYVAMPASLLQAAVDTGESSGALAVKVLTFYKDNPDRTGRPSISATVLLHDPRDGALLAIMEGAALTRLRTAGGSGVATRYLARADASVVGVLGSGGEAETHLLAMAEVRPVREARVYSRNPARRAAFATRMAARLGFPVVPTSDARGAVEGADIIVTVTTAGEPIVDSAWIADGAHINCIGSGSPERRELDDATVSRAKVVVDTRESALAEAGDLLIPMSKGLITADWIHAELGEVVTGRRPGRTSDREVTLFKSVGVALQDVAAAAAAYRQARAMGLGRTLDL